MQATGEDLTKMDDVLAKPHTEVLTFIAYSGAKIKLEKKIMNDKLNKN